MNKEIEVGDVVVLKSGGPKMTVYTIEDNEVGCCYFKDDSGITTTLRLPTICVELHEETPLSEY